jgi:hypothetical protein
MRDDMNSTELLPESVRRAIFAAVVEAQDNGVPVAASRSDTGCRFGVSPAVVARIEREGLDGHWPPLDILD